jgi:tetratricopeptide (TPR) repeat protein
MRTIERLMLVAAGLLVGWAGSAFLAGAERDAESDASHVETGRTGRAGANPSAASERSAAMEAGLQREIGAALAATSAPTLGGTTTADREAMRQARGWAALLTLHALADRRAEFVRAVPDALASGVTPEFVIDTVRLFPRAGRADLLQEVLAAQPGGEWPAGECADAFVEAGDTVRAVRVLASALRDAPHQALIERLVEIDPDQAPRLLAKIADEGEWPVRRLAQVAAALVTSGRPALAAGFYQAALQKEPLDRGLIEKLARVAPDLALAHARRVAQEQGTNHAAWANLGATELAAGNPRDAFEAYRQAAAHSLTREALHGLMRADPQRAYAVALGLAGAEPDADTLGAIARLALAGDRTTEAVDALLRAHGRDPSDHRWNAALVAADPARAAEALAATARDYRGRRRDEIVGALGDALLETGSARAAFDQYREAFQLDPSDGAWQRGLARSDPARAVSLLESRRRTAGDDASLLGALADAYAGTGRTAEARALYEQAAQRDGGTRWYARLALVDLPGARRGLEAATAREPDSGDAWGALGDCCRVAGDVAAARAAYARARDLEPASFVWATRLRALGPAR